MLLLARLFNGFIQNGPPRYAEYVTAAVPILKIITVPHHFPELLGLRALLTWAKVQILKIIAIMSRYTIGSAARCGKC